MRNKEQKIIDGKDFRVYAQAVSFYNNELSKHGERPQVGIGIDKLLDDGQILIYILYTTPEFLLGYGITVGRFLRAVEETFELTIELTGDIIDLFVEKVRKYNSSYTNGFFPIIIMDRVPVDKSFTKNEIVTVQFKGLGHLWSLGEFWGRLLQRHYNFND